MALSRLARVPGAGTRSTSGREPLAGAATSTRSMPCRSMSQSRRALMPSTASGISRTGRTVSERWACMPSLPAGVTAKPARVRQPRPGRRRPAAAALPHGFHRDPLQRAGSSTPASRRSCSASTSALRLRWRSREMWPSSAPPTGGWRCDQERAESARSQKCVHPVRGGSRTSTTSARQNLASVAGVGQPDPDLFAGDAVADEHHAALVPGHAVPAVGDGPDVDDEFGWRACVWVSGLIGYPAVSLLLRTISAATARWPP